MPHKYRASNCLFADLIRLKHLLVDPYRPTTQNCQISGQVHSCRSLAYATFLINNRDYFCHTLYIIHQIDITYKIGYNLSYYNNADVVELVDTHDSKSCAARHVGSIPTVGTKV